MFSFIQNLSLLYLRLGSTIQTRLVLNLCSSYFNLWVLGLQVHTTTPSMPWYFFELFFVVCLFDWLILHSEFFAIIRNFFPLSTQRGKAEGQKYSSGCNTVRQERQKADWRRACGRGGIPGCLVCPWLSTAALHLKGTKTETSGNRRINNYHWT